MAKPLFLFAHGAGAPSSSEWMLGWAKRLGRIGKVRAFDYPYMQAGRRSPDALPKLIEAHRSALKDATKRHAGPTLLIGKSMGGRVGCHLALDEPVSGVICMGYPLKGMGKTSALRDQVLLDLIAPVLFVQGTRDSLCPLDLLAKVRKEMRARHELYVVESGNHSLLATKSRLKAEGKTQDQIDDEILEAIRKFVDSVA